ncbi:MAG: aspartate carbamoyltransferase [Candidatus Taylorbacteria bacterium RIFCSPHIGHO2_01_FULL_45_63]|uniref:Aspartate carbamoyltransferase n=1 Tax=Candidatus Taylorbacteria bacterium RIFCSPHIGHO2_02_FULL_45_35 TaxID=1802311 RepID=A0A1G2MXJ3_9BACT|nr:MAG: aspartate carbamoyltransferase [Candidatus Taylorbacteria bacterium RIFCSPHIGHO2_01_FULL_45_63]OHA27929.1 MAG: aspartate carbamoyltransferase [Candidatus Taylorbacteria bacterium RIFCSPHIGHO2_02_FULL_45_35]OHA34838.1 MAG: aspartate carbamoyltransferase [Candidatus Taylorbacteria bacterium RIFCSPLOWO2_01_FULL_45_34b]
MNHIIEAQQFDQKFVNKIFSIAGNLEKKTETPLKGKIMASLFYEPSTRTRFSFESAMLRLGGSIITTENAKEFSSVAKGETLEDSIRVIDNYADVIILRHNEEGASRRAASVSDVPIVNAGDGTGQHPTQALLDLYTIKRELGVIDGIRIALIGDLKHGRTIHSLAYLLGKYKNIKIYFVSIKTLKVGDDIKRYLIKHGVVFEEIENLDSIIGHVDVLYQTRIQKERFKTNKEYKKCRSCYRIDSTLVEKMKQKSIIMHPLPRVDEILFEVDSSPKAAYFRQAHYGLFIRMALLKYLLE